jgi:hypothetical protein
MRVLGIVALCPALGGCASAPPPAPVASFNPSEANYSRLTFDVYGHLFADADGDQRAAENIQVRLLGG